MIFNLLLVGASGPFAAASLPQGHPAVRAAGITGVADTDLNAFSAVYPMLNLPVSFWLSAY